MKMLENRVLRRKFEHNRQEVRGEVRKLQNDKLHNLSSSRNIIRVINLRRIGCAGHVA
jgi:hypothetical protein